MTASGPDSRLPVARVIDVAAALVFRESRLLITQRPAGSHLEGLWEFPGGKLEPGETWTECLQRELREELDLEVLVGELFSEVTHAYPEKVVRLRFFKCRPAGAEPKAIGCAALRWVDRDSLTNFEFPPADAQLLQALLADSSIWV